MKKLTSSVYTFADLIANDFLYVDKTEFIWKLVRPATGLYFLSRPRRFGKSLTLSTLKAVFEGRRELFEGLAIAKKGYGWKPYPVIHLDLNGFRFGDVAEMEHSLQKMVRDCAAEHQVQVADDVPENMLRDLIGALSAQEQVVVLVDEYDKPILITPPSIILSFGFSALVGIVFGFFPAFRASSLNPIDCLRYE